jgi:hypothetical protein
MCFVQGHIGLASGSIFVSGPVRRLDLLLAAGILLAVLAFIWSGRILPASPLQAASPSTPAVTIEKDGTVWRQMAERPAACSMTAQSGGSVDYTQCVVIGNEPGAPPQRASRPRTSGQLTTVTIEDRLVGFAWSG